MLVSECSVHLVTFNIYRYMQMECLSYDIPFGALAKFRETIFFKELLNDADTQVPLYHGSTPPPSVLDSSYSLFHRRLLCVSCRGCCVTLSYRKIQSVKSPI